MRSTLYSPGPGEMSNREVNQSIVEKMYAFFVGQTMKASKGSANPQKVNELIKERLSK